MKSFRITSLITLILLTTFLWQCGQPGTKQAAAYSPEITARIQQVETNLLPAIVIKGQEKQGYDIAERMKVYKVPGVSVAVIDNGKIEWAKGYGLAEKDSGRKVNKETMFQAASISKSAAAMAALKLAEKGKIDLEDDTDKFLKSWKIPANEFTGNKKITPALILNHSAGLTVHGFRGYGGGEEVPTLLQLLDGKEPANSDPIRVDIEPGSKWRYSGGGYCVIQQMMIDVTGKAFPQLMAELVLDPLGLKNSTYEQPLPETLRNNAAVGYRGDGKPVKGNYHTYPEMAAAGLWTTPSDLARFAVEIQESLAGKSNKVLSQKMTQNMTTARKGRYGLGLSVRGEGKDANFSHGGANEGFRCILIAYVETGKGAAIMTNSDNGGTISTEILRSISKVYDWPDFKTKEKEVVKIEPASLEAFAGSYLIAEKYEISVFVREEKLFFTDPDGVDQRLYPESETKFFAAADGVVLEFVRDETGKVHEIKIAAGGTTYIAKRKD